VSKGKSKTFSSRLYSRNKIVHKAVSVVKSKLLAEKLNRRLKRLAKNSRAVKYFLKFRLRSKIAKSKSKYKKKLFKAVARNRKNKAKFLEKTLLFSSKKVYATSRRGSFKYTIKKPLLIKVNSLSD
jgi:hypothetical protein